MQDLVIRLAVLRADIPALRLYVLVDGLQYQTVRCKPLLVTDGLVPLFAGTPDEALADAGPWLGDAEQLQKELLADIAELETRLPSVSWLIAPQDGTGLAQLLQLKLDVQLPDGRTALLRFWDPRVLANLVDEFDEGQQAQFFGNIHEWHFLKHGRRVWIRRQDANAH